MSKQLANTAAPKRAEEDTKVLKFPKMMTKEAAVRVDKQTKKRADRFMANMIVDGFHDDIIDTLSSAEIDVDNELISSEIAVTVELLRATLYRQFKIRHPLQNTLRALGRRLAELNVDKKVSE